MMRAQHSNFQWNRKIFIFKTVLKPGGRDYGLGETAEMKKLTLTLGKFRFLKG
jgi:hypothetical protein